MTLTPKQRIDYIEARKEITNISFYHHTIPIVDYLSNAYSEVDLYKEYKNLVSTKFINEDGELKITYTYSPETKESNGNSAEMYEALKVLTEWYNDNLDKNT